MGFDGWRQSLAYQKRFYKQSFTKRFFFPYFAVMFGLLHQYLVECRQVFLQGIGQLKLVRQHAVYDVASQQIKPPFYNIELDADAQPGPLQPVTAFIAKQLKVSEEKAFELYHSFCNQLKTELDSSGEIAWQNLGSIKKATNEKPVFKSLEALHEYQQPVAAPRVIREGASHNMMVGTTETTNHAMREMLEETTVVKDRWWIGAAILAASSIALIVLRKMGYM